MLIKFLFLFTITLISVQSKISEERILSDATRWTELHDEYMNVAPYQSLRLYFKVQWHIMLECCPDERENFFNPMHRHTSEETCYGNSTLLSLSANFNSFIGKLKEVVILRKWWILILLLQEVMNDSMNGEYEWKQYVHLMNLLFIVIQKIWVYFNHVKKKVLRYVAEENHDDYVLQWKNHYGVYIRQLGAAFSN